MARRIPEHFIQSLLNRVDIVDLVKARVPLKKRGANYSGLCPFHQEKSPSFTVSEPKQFYHCFGCGKHGNAVGFLMDYENYGFVEAIEELAKSLGLSIPYEGESDNIQEQTEPLYKALSSASTLFQKNLRSHTESAFAVNYLKGRGVSGKTAKRFNIGFAPDEWELTLKQLKSEGYSEDLINKTGLVVQKENKVHFYDRFRGRIMFPIHDLRGRVIGFGGRIMAQGEPKYLNSPETPVFHKGRTLYGLYEAKQAVKTLTQILIVEGYMDVIMLAQSGIAYAVATLGTATTEEHIRLLAKESKELIFCFDGDRAGKDAAWRALKVCLPFMTGALNIHFLFLPDNEDPDSLVQKEGKARFEQRLTQAEALGEFLLKTCAKDFNLRTIGGKSQYISSLKSYFEKIPDGSYRMILEETLAKRLGLLAEQLRQLWDNGVLQRQEAKTYASNIPKNLELLERIIALLLAYPTLAQQLRQKKLHYQKDHALFAILVSLKEFILAQEAQHLGMILAHFEHADFYQILVDLGTHPYTEIIKDPENEFKDLLNSLNATEQQDHLEALLAKARMDELQPDEKAQLKQLLAARHDT